MKMTTLKSVAIAVGLASSAFGQATSPVVGYETLTLQPDTFNLTGFRLHGKAAASGTFDSVVAGTSLTDSSGDFSGLTATSMYVATLTDGSTIVFAGSDASGGTINFSSASNAELQDYTVREANTLDSTLGNPPAELAGSATGAQSGADVVWVPNGSGGFNQYYYITAAGAEGWYDFNAPTAPLGSAVVIEPGTGVFIQTAGSTAGTVDVVVSGAVKTSPTVYGISGEWNLIGGVYPAGSTLDSTGLSAFVAGSATGAQTGADVVWLPNASGFSQYYYITAAGAEGWYDFNAPTAPLGATTEVTPGFFIQDADGTGGGVLSAPSFYATL